MDEVDIENADDLNELEARLYAQIHHEPSGVCDFSVSYREALPVRQVTSTRIINNKSVDKNCTGRYWSDQGNVRTPSRPKEKTSDVKSDSQQSVTPLMGGEIKEQPAETIDKLFQPPVKNLSNLRVNPFASGNGPKTKGSLTQKGGKTAGAAKAVEKKTEPNATKGPFVRQFNKLANAVKYDAKKQKAKAARAKAKNAPAVELIELLSSSNESDADDVIEVPLPPPKIVTIDSSSEEDNFTEDKNNFVKPQASVTKENSSRCTSPCSVVSDDFIVQNDRSRLLEENDRPDDEDLLMLQEDVDGLMENPWKNGDKASRSFVAPATGGGSAKTTTDYRVTQDDFRALDVYESESDIQESVYSKGSKNIKPSMVVRLEHESSSGDDEETINITQKTKRLRKRRASSCNKESEINIDSTDSEQENEADNEANRSHEGVPLTRIPFIARGEAIEDYVSTDPPVAQRIVNSSDNEFLAILTTLAQGTSATLGVAHENESDEVQEQITARSIAENVIRKEKRSVQKIEPVIVHNEEANDAIPTDAIPNKTFTELNPLFQKIDNMNKNIVSIIELDDSDKSVELISPLPVEQNNGWVRNNRLSNKIENNYGDPVYNIVYCEGVTLFGGIGWNEEMLKFYNNSWNGESFNVNAICGKMKTTKSLWKIYTDDRFPKYRKNSNQRCMNCCECGHIRSKCPKPRRPQVCYMCGESGHHEPRCPNTICLRCGNKTRMFTKSCNACNYQNRLVCPICKVRGHSLNLCPDKWRRYHSTTRPNEYPNNQVEYKNRKFCCICGCRGHLAENCRNALRFTEYPLFVSEIRSHQKSYEDLAIKTMRMGIGYNLMYKPEEDLSFELAENKTRYHYYGRFLVAVGLGHLLTRKRKPDSPEKDEPVDKQSKNSNVFKDYVVNPFAKAAMNKSPSKSTANLSTEQHNVSEAEPSSLRNATTLVNTMDSSVNESTIIYVDEISQTEPSTLTDSFKTPNATSSSSAQLSISTHTDVDNVTEAPNLPSTSSQALRENEVLEMIDSDSNYCFSEYFEPPQEKENSVKIREMELLPDYIPISDDWEELPGSATLGVSRRFVSIDTDDENSNMDSSLLPEIPCEAKIYLTNFHSKFLLSPEGNKFLVEKSNAFNIKARLDWTSVGHILVIFGIRVNQDKFHTELLHKFRDLSDKLNRKNLENSQKIPKRTEALIRFLRDDLNQLLTNLGNVNDLFNRLTNQENQHTKSGWKSAEKTRRLLNMVLIGQAGLLNGSWHLDHLLSHLRNLINECKEAVVPNDLRKEIDSHWKLIFSSYRHEKYNELIEAYNHMHVKNRLQNINIDPRLLGNKILDTTLTKAQKDKMDKWPEVKTDIAGTPKQSAPPKLVPNPVATKYQARQIKTPTSEKKHPKNVSTNSPSVSQTPPNSQKPKTLSVNSPVANKIKAVNEEWETKCVNLLTEIDNTGKVKKGPLRDSKAISVFWSREAMKYIDECIQLGKSNAGLMEKLSRVQKKSHKGLLSYNDYRAIIKIHNAIKGKQ